MGVVLYRAAATDVPDVCNLAAGTAVVWSSPGPGAGRINEDAAAVISLASGGVLLAVADGMGGHAGAADASRLAVESLRDAAAASGPGDDPRSAVLDGIEQAHAAIRALGVGAGTTLVVAEFDGGMVRPYHVGDAGMLIVGQRGKVKLATVSHSPVGYAVESGMIDADEAMHHAERHVVSNALGAEDMHVQVGSPRALAPRDTVLLASDGLLDNLHEAEIVRLIRTGPLARGAAVLAERAAARMDGAEPNAPSKPDDCTFVLFRLALAQSR